MELSRLALLGALRARLTKGLRRSSFARRSRDRYRRVHSSYEPLEPRLVLAQGEPDVISVGRVLSSWSASDVVDGQLKVTYSVYNQQAEAVSGVLLTTTLASGVEFVTASQLPDRFGQELAWSLGTLDPFGRTSVEVTVALASPMQLVVDDGAAAFGTLNARAVTDEANPAALRAAPIDPNLLRSTPDANTTDPFILAKAAELNQDPAEIFHYLTQDVGYESYVGSLRGSRGTLWSSAGNALDEASLGIALLRSSGIPARYVEGTLPDSLAQELILSMFPEPFQVVGYIPAGTEVADPANDPQLLAETREHYWIQFDTGAGLQDVDTTFSDARVGQTFAATEGTFDEVPDALRHKVKVKLNAEIHSQANALFGLGNGLSTTTVLEHMFNTVDLVGRPLSIGHFVDSQPLGAFFLTTITNTYSPYIVLGDEAFDLNQNVIIRGTDYQEVANNIFPFVSQVLTGLFLELIVSGPDGVPQTYDRALVDRIGFAARQGVAYPSISIDLTQPPALNNTDVFTVSILGGRQSAVPLARTSRAALQHIQAASQFTVSDSQGALSSLPSLRNFFAANAQARAIRYLLDSDVGAMAFGDELLLKSYYDRPRITIVSEQYDPIVQRLAFSIDLRRESQRVIVSPGQELRVAVYFNFLMGLLNDVLEEESDAVPATSQSLGTANIFRQARAQAISLVHLSQNNTSSLSTLNISENAKAYISKAIGNGLLVVVPASPVLIGGRSSVSWFEIDSVTGEVVGVLENGIHSDLIEYPAIVETETLTSIRVLALEAEELAEFEAYYLEYLAEVQRLGALARNAEAAAKYQEVAELSNIILDRFPIGNAADAVLPGLGNALDTGIKAVPYIAQAIAHYLYSLDPPVPRFLMDPQPFDALLPEFAIGAIQVGASDLAAPMSLHVSAIPSMLLTDQNTAVTFQSHVSTSASDIYDLVAQVPEGWTVVIGDDAQVTVTPKPGTQSGDFLIRLVARSQSNPDLVAAAEVTVTVTPTLPGLDFEVVADPVFTVPSFGTQLPTAFRATMHNLGPEADTYDLTFPNPPAGFNILRSLENVTVPAGETGIVGIYLEPSGQVLPPGTQVTFTVVARSTSDPNISESRTLTFAMPEVAAVAVESDPLALAGLPGAPVSAQVTLRNAGNVPYNIGAGFTLPSGLAIEAPTATMTLGVGQSTTHTVTFTPAVGTPLNSTLTPTFTFGPAVTQELVSVVGVRLDRSFVESGQETRISAQILGALPQVGPVTVGYVVRSPQGSMVFQSTPVARTLSNVPTSLTVDVGVLNTNGFAPGEYTIDVSVTRATNQPIPSATGQAKLVVGLPIAASQEVTPQTLNEGLELTYVTHDATVTSTINVSTQPLVGSVQTAGTARTIALSGALAYVAGTEDITIVDLANLANPRIVRTFGGDVLNKGGSNLARLAGNRLIVATQDVLNSRATKLLVYDLADPENPQLAGSSTVPYSFLGDLLVDGSAAVGTISTLSFALPGTILGQFGDVLALDLTNTVNPALADVLFDDVGPPSGGPNNVHGGAIVTSGLAYIGSTTSTGRTPQEGVGRLLVVDTADPDNLSLVREVQVPGTRHLGPIAVEGNLALVAGTTGGWRNPFNGFADIGLDGNVTLTLLDISNPRNPQVLSTTLTQGVLPRGAAFAKEEVIALGSGRFAVSGVQTEDDGPVLLIVDAADSNNVQVRNLAVPALVNGMAVSGGLLHTTSAGGISAYRIAAITEQPVHVEVRVPAGGGAAVVSDSFNLAPTQVVSGASFDTLVWDLTFDAARTTQDLTWDTAITGMPPGTTREITLGGTVRVGAAGGGDDLTLPPLVVASVPATQSLQIPIRVVVPGADAIATAAIAAGQLGEPDLANRLSDLSIALTNLVQTPASEIAKSQSTTSLDAIIRIVAADPILNIFSVPLSRERDVLSAATTPEEIQTAVEDLGLVLDDFGGTVVRLVRHNFEIRVLGASLQTALPQTPTRFDVLVHNLGTETTTYNVNVSGLPAGVTVDISEPSVTLQRDAVATVFVSLTPVSEEELRAFDFTIEVSVDGVSPPLLQTAMGSLGVRSEFLSVPSVAADPPFTEPGGLVAVSARVLNVVNRRQEALVSYVVKDSGGAVVFSSTPATVQFNLATSLLTVNLGTFDTTGRAPGQYSIEVMVSDAAGDSIPGGVGRGSLLIGSPVTATLAVNTEVLPPGTSTVTNTLQIQAEDFPGALSELGHVQTTNLSTSVVLYDDVAYVASTRGIDIVDVSDPTAPVVVKTFGENDLGTIDSAFIRRQGDMLIVGVTRSRDALRFRLLIYSLTDPQNPQLISSTPFNYDFVTDLIVRGDTILATTVGTAFSFGGFIVDTYGTVLSIDISDPAAPLLADVLFSTIPPPRGGGSAHWSGVAVTDSLAYVASTSAAGTNFRTGEGRLRVVDYSDASDLSIVRQVRIPGTYIVFDIALDGDRALVLGNSDPVRSPGGGYLGNFTLTVLDISDPSNPRPIGTTHVTDATWPSPAGATRFAESLGGGLFAITATFANAERALFFVDANDPSNITVTTIPVPAVVNEMAVGGDRLYTTSAAGMTIYEFGASGSLPVTAQVQIPNGTGVEVVAGSFNIPPTEIIEGAEFDTLIFDFTLTSSDAPETITWQSTVTGLQPGQTREVTLGTTIDFSYQGAAGQITLPPTNVAAEQVLSLDPPSRSVRPGEAAAYTVTIANPAQTGVTYDLSVLGVPGAWVDFDSQVTIPAGGSVDLPLVLTSGPFTPPAEVGFVVVATTGGIAGQVEGTLTLVGEPVLPEVDPQSHGVVLALSPTQATAGQGTPAHYTARLTNTGSATDTFRLVADVVPPGLSVSFEQDTLTIPPGASNFREVSFTVVAAPGTPPNSYAFSILASSTTEEEVSDAAVALLNVVASGVDVEFMPDSGTPGSTYDLLVTNTGTVTDTFTLSVAAPAALVAALETTSVTLGPGQSQMVTVTVGEIDFAFPGALPLVGAARSTTDSAVMDADTADVMIAGELGIAAAFAPDSIELSAPGMTSLLLLVENIGNLEDAYSATITSVTGPLSARLTDLDGTLVNSIELFRLPGLSTGAILVQADLAAFGTGTITVLIRSLTDESITATATATIRAVSGSQTSSISGFSYVDVNNNGQFDASELPLLGTPIVLVDEAGNTVAATFSNLEGLFRFDGLAAGTYTIEKVQSPLFFDGKDTPGSLGDSDAIADQFTLSLPAQTAATDYLFAERGLLPQYIGKSPYLSSTPANLWENLNLRLADLWHAFEPESEIVQAAVEFAAASGDVKLQVFDAQMRLIEPQSLSGELVWHVTPGERHYLRLSGTNNNVDLSIVFASATTAEGPPLAGDFDDSGAVDQADLDLVLLAWGQDAAELQPTWRRNTPQGLVGQLALDEVLLNWGR